jgi:hypothetical protein
MIRNAFVFVFDKNSSNVIFWLPHVTVVGFSVLATLHDIEGFGFDFTQCPGSKSGVFEAGAKPNLIAAIGSGYLIALVNPKRAR